MSPRRKLILLSALFLFTALAIFSKRSQNKTLATNFPSPSISATPIPVARQLKSEIYQRVVKIRERRLYERRSPKEEDQTKSAELFQNAMQAYGTDSMKTKTLLREALERYRDNVQALGILAGVALNEGSRDEAVRLASECIAIDRKSKECHTVLISSFTRAGEFEESYGYLRDCLQEDPNNVHCLGGLESYYLNKGELGEARILLDRITQAEPNSVWTFLAQGTYFEKSGEAALAFEAYIRACKLGQSFACSRVKKGVSRAAD